VSTARAVAVAGALSGFALCLTLLVCERFHIGNTIADDGPGFGVAACISYVLAGSLFGVAVGPVLSRNARLTKYGRAPIAIMSGTGYLAARYVTLVVLSREMHWFGDATPPDWLADLFCLTSGIAGGFVGAGFIWGGFAACGKQHFLTVRVALRTVVIPSFLGGILLVLAVILNSPDADDWPNGKLASLLIHIPWQAYLGFALCQASDMPSSRPA
jgi:hypothetical protein